MEDSRRPMTPPPGGRPAHGPGPDWFQPTPVDQGRDDQGFAALGGDLFGGDDRRPNGTAPPANGNGLANGNGRHWRADDATEVFPVVLDDWGRIGTAGEPATERPGRHGADRDRPAFRADPEPAGDRDDKPAPKAAARRKLPFWVELPILLLVALALTFVIQTFVARVYVIPSGSMETTLNGNNGTGDRILVDKIVYNFHGPQPGDVVVFKGPDGWDQTEFFVSASSNPVVHWLHQLASSVGAAKPDEYDLVKRVIAVGGQTVQCCDARNRILVNGKPLTEPYVYWQPDRGGPNTQLRFGPITVPQGYLWVMGDNRNNSNDSRYQNGGGVHGVVPVGNVIGKARTIIWPASRWRGIGDDNPQTMALASAPGWFGAVPSGAGALAAFPTLWLGRRGARRLGRARPGRARQDRGRLAGLRVGRGRLCGLRLGGQGQGGRQLNGWRLGGWRPGRRRGPR